MAEISVIYLLDSASGEAVEAELRDAIEEAHLVDWQTQWQPAMIETLRALASQKVPMADWPQSWHWDWRRKTTGVQGLLGYPGFSVVAQGVTQGLAQIDLTRSACAPEHAGKPMAYIDYLEVAPWNRPDLGQVPRLRGVGTALLSAAVARSMNDGFKGRIGLHSLPQSEGFYQRNGLTDLGPDAAYQGLRYFEMNAERATAFLEEE